MTKMNEPQNSEVEVSDAQLNFCREAVAIYLHHLANLIQNKVVNGFDLAWGVEDVFPKPTGDVVFDATYFITPLPDMPQAQQKEKDQDNRIPVEDRSNRPGPRKCNDPHCPNCRKQCD